MRILSKEEATKVERPEGMTPWSWPEPAFVAVSDCFRVLGVLGAKSAEDGESPLSLALAVNFFETLYAAGYAIVKLDTSEVPPATIDLAQAARLIEGVSGLAEITSGSLHTELVNMLMGVPAVEVDQVWTGISGNRLVVREITHGRARLSYEDDPGSEIWEDVEDVRMSFTLASPRPPAPDENSPGAVLVDVAHEQWLAEGTE
jgi:hypothetical protein